MTSKKLPLQPIVADSEEDFKFLIWVIYKNNFNHDQHYGFQNLLN